MFLFFTKIISTHSLPERALHKFEWPNHVRKFQRVPACDHWKDPAAQFPQVWASIGNTDMSTFLILLVSDINDKKLQFWILNEKT